MELGGIRVGLFGLTLEDERAPWLEYGMAGRAALVRATIDSLRAQGAELIVALTHQNIDQDEALARAFPEIALICGGHEHLALDSTVDHPDGRRTRIVKADADAITALEIRVSRQKVGFAIDPVWKALDASVAEDPAMAKFVAESLERLSQAIQRSTGKTWDTLYGTTEHALEGLEPKIRTRETALGNFLADALRNRFKTDFGFVNGGAVRINDDIFAGHAVETLPPKERRDLFGVIQRLSKTIADRYKDKNFQIALRPPAVRATPTTIRGDLLAEGGEQGEGERRDSVRQGVIFVLPINRQRRRSGKTGAQRIIGLRDSRCVRHLKARMMIAGARTGCPICRACCRLTVNNWSTASPAAIFLERRLRILPVL